MDRDNRWERIRKSFNTIVYGDDLQNQSPTDSIKESYKKNINDEFFIPKSFNNYKGINFDKDGILILNFRADRIRQILQSLLEKDFNKFNRGDKFTTITKNKSLGIIQYSSS